MIERPLMTSDELKSMPKGDFIVMKAGSNPMRVKLILYQKWEIHFEKTYHVLVNPEQQVEYITKQEILKSIVNTKSLPITPKKGVLKVE